jgi:hypothetical protein
MRDFLDGRSRGQFLPARIVVATSGGWRLARIKKNFCLAAGPFVHIRNSHDQDLDK